MKTVIGWLTAGAVLVLGLTVIWFGGKWLLFDRHDQETAAAHATATRGRTIVTQAPTIEAVGCSDDRTKPSVIEVPGNERSPVLAQPADERYQIAIWSPDDADIELCSLQGACFRRGEPRPPAKLIYVMNHGEPYTAYCWNQKNPE